MAKEKTQMNHPVYYAFKVEENLIAIQEKHLSTAQWSVMMYLVIGQEKAALIDSGFGVTDTLRGFVESLTDRPVICIVAHGHPDHVGAAALFDTVYMSEKDEPLLPISLSYERRMGDVFGNGLDGRGQEIDEELKAYCETHIVMPEHFSYEKLSDGDVFDLGGAQLAVIAIPGHTQGSVALVNKAEHYALTSDCFSRRTALVKLPREKRVGITAFRDGLARFLDSIDGETRIYWGHGTEAMEHSIPQDMLRAAKEILDGKTEKDRPSQSPFTKRKAIGDQRMMEHDCGIVTLVYDANTL
ncbi:MAG: MBL fold metallo-hydrolase [Clostridia bacterium]|nr:MBL fold metallo-hydrolase [Clostridia bacterium]